MITIFYLNSNIDFEQIIQQSWQLFTLVDYIKYAIYSKCTHVNINIDLSKSFDTLNFDILLYKLHYYGITDIALKLIKSYISNKKTMLNIMLMKLFK